MISVWIFLGVIHAVLFGGETQHLKFKENWNNNVPPQVIEFQNFTVFINYANNVFGVSKSIFKKKKNANSTEILFLKGYPLKTPDLRNVKFKPTSSLKVENEIMGMRSKRGVLHLYNMISCATGCNPLSYKGYGCYCGFLGSGKSVDGIDRCCQSHDECYEISGCQLFLQYIVPYFWKCYYNRPLCAIDHDEFGGPESCASRLCQCDKRLSECLRRFPCPNKRPVCYSSPLRAIQNIFMSVIN